MSVLQHSLHSQNPFSEKEFWGRYPEKHNKKHKILQIKKYWLYQH